MKVTAPRATRSRGPLVLNSAINTTAVFTIATLVLMVAVIGTPAQAQNFAVLHAFTGGGDGGSPNGISAVDPKGNLYGTAASGGVTNDNCPQGCGNVFELKHSGGNWLVDPLYDFRGNLDYPVFGITRAANGAIYGQDRAQNGSDDPGVVYELTSVAGHWNLNVLYQFNNSRNDAYNSVGEVILDAEGNIYGTSNLGGGWYGGGVVYELTFTGGQWVEKDLFYFLRKSGGKTPQGIAPLAGVVMDQQGNLYGTTTMGSTHGCGAVFQLTPTQSGFWNGHTLYSFPALGAQCSTATGGVILDAAGNVYGEVTTGSPSSGVFELSPSGGGWTYTLLYGATWGGSGGSSGINAPRLVMDSAGNLYGTTGGGTYCDPQCDDGTVFKLTRRSNGSWKHSLLYKFQYDSLNSGIYPGGDLSVDSSGNLYGTTSMGGDTSCNPPNGCGVAYEITP